uniref:Uncharacterized protein n=1 Tax=Octopus bimaculoides TaxID=37653 RepID=A0A0L8G6Y3_OCTBM
MKLDCCYDNTFFFFSILTTKECEIQNIRRRIIESYRFHSLSYNTTNHSSGRGIYKAVRYARVFI